MSDKLLFNTKVKVIGDSIFRGCVGYVMDFDDYRIGEDRTQRVWKYSVRIVSDSFGKNLLSDDNHWCNATREELEVLQASPEVTGD